MSLSILSSPFIAFCMSEFSSSKSTDGVLAVMQHLSEHGAYSIATENQTVSEVSA